MKRITIPNADCEDDRIDVHLPETDEHGRRRTSTYYTYFSMGQAAPLFEALVEILGAQPISPELAAGLWEMYQAARCSPDHTTRSAFIDVLTNGLKYSARGIPTGTKEPSAWTVGEVAEAAEAAADAAGVASREAGGAAADAKRVWDGHETRLRELAFEVETLSSEQARAAEARGDIRERLDEIALGLRVVRARLDALELHRLGANDGVAEMAYRAAEQGEERAQAAGKVDAGSTS